MLLCPRPLPMHIAQTDSLRTLEISIFSISFTIRVIVAFKHEVSTLVTLKIISINQQILEPEKQSLGHMTETYWTQLSFEAWRALEAESKLRGKSSDAVASEIILSAVSAKAKEIAEKIQPQDVSLLNEAELMSEQGQFHHGSPGYR
ncbi:Uncharacterised protein [uncultured archaeon]|nr:Uncharacterised protein [uncultured archaeon]